MVEFDCADCGIHVFAVVLDTVPDDKLCSVCHWLVEFVPDLEHREAIRKRIHGDENG